jgi:hypothetical protein
VTLLASRAFAQQRDPATLSSLSFGSTLPWRYLCLSALTLSDQQLQHGNSNMAAAIPAPQALYSLLFGDASKWENFAPDYNVLSNYFENGAPAATANQCCDGLAGLATRTPVVVALVSDNECEPSK